MSFQANMTYTTTIRMITVECCACGCIFGMPSDLDAKFQEDAEKYFYCPNGHRQHYSESTAIKLRRELERKNNQLAQAQTTKIQLEVELTKVQRKLKRTETRVKNGVCPCCNRTFSDLANHMKSKHPEFPKH